MRTTTQKWKDLWDAIEAMEVGDPPLRWTDLENSARRASVYITNHYRRSPNFRIKTFCVEEELWIIKLPPERSIQRGKTYMGVPIA